jgi:trehalose synthase
VQVTVTEMGLEQVRVEPVVLEHLAAIIGPERAAALRVAAATAQARLTGRVLFHINSTATGGGVAELLQTLLATAGGLGVDTRWLVIDGDADFFTITKRLHNHLYGAAGDGGGLGSVERQHYEAVLAANATELLGQVSAEDIVVLHDPQTAGLAPALLAAGIRVVWRCHVGIDTQNDRSRLAWDFLRPYLEQPIAFVFSCEQFAPDWVPRDRLQVIAPSIDPLSAKNQTIGTADVRRTLQQVELLGGGTGQPGATFRRRDGSYGRVRRRVALVDGGPPPPPDVPIVLQASRWDALKDMCGVMEGFAENLADMGSAHLVLAGPSVTGVADDPEAAAVLDHCLRHWQSLPGAHRGRIHLACVTMTDADEAAVIVNAMQRHARVVVQKSLAEGFGLTVAEAMWKSRPVVGSAVGGIVDQIVDGLTGCLIDDAHDLNGYAAAVGGLLDDPALADRMGQHGYTRVHEHFLSDRHLQQWGQLIETLP